MILQGEDGVDYTDDDDDDAPAADVVAAADDVVVPSVAEKRSAGRVETPSVVGPAGPAG